MAGEPAVLGGGRDQGYLDQHRYRVYRGPDGGGAVIALDCYGELAAISNLTAISGAVMGGCALITLAIIVPVSKRALRPYVRNLERQRRFVTDASHELKTPVAIITADTDLLEAISGENQWTRSTHKQAARLSELIGDLIALARARDRRLRDRPVHRPLGRRAPRRAHLRAQGRRRPGDPRRAAAGAGIRGVRTRATRQGEPPGASHPTSGRPPRRSAKACRI